MYEPLKVAKCEKCGTVIAEPKELIRMRASRYRILICERCGSCCVQYDGNNFATEDDIKRWVYQVRCDILQYCYGFEEWGFWDVVSEDNNAQERVISHLIKNLNNVVWFDPDMGDQLYICPFLRKKYGKAEFECLIHDTRPWACRQFFCNPNGDTPPPIGTVHARIIKKSFKESLKEYRKKRKWECENRNRNNIRKTYSTTKRTNLSTLPLFSHILLLT